MSEQRDSGPTAPSTGRRRFLAVAGSAATAATAGCLGFLETESLTAPPVLDDRPEAVYFPTHVEGMVHANTVEVGDYRLALLYSYAHRFWTVSGTDRTKKPADKDVHLMASLFDPDTETVVSDTGLSMKVEQDGDLVARETVYRMLSQRMGFHYGANFPLSGDGSYDVEVTVGAVASTPRLTGTFEGDFTEPRTVTVPFEYSQAERDDIDFENTEDRAGERAAVDPMSMGALPNAVAPPAADLPGDVWEGSHADARYAATVATGDAADRLGAGDDEAYLLVSPRTPHNRMILPRIGLAATAEAGGETVFDGSLTPTLDHEFDYHYGATVPRADVDALSLTVETPPQVARHEGYETAFLTTGEVALER